MHPEYSRSSAPRDTGSWRLGPGGRQLRGTATPQPYTFEPRKLSPAGPPASYVGSVDQRWCREGSGECGDNNVGLTEARPVPGATLASGDCVGDWPNAEAEAECCEHRPMVNLRPTRNRAPKRPAEGQEGAGSTHLEQPHPTSAHQQHRANRKGHQRGERRKADQRPPNAASGLTSQGSSSKSWRSPTKRERRALEQPHFERTGGASLRQLERDVTAAGGTGACGSTHPSVEQQQPKRLAYSHHKAPFTTQEHVQSSLQHQIRKRKRARDTQQLQHTGWRHELQQQRSGCDEWKRAEEGEGEGEDAPARRFVLNPCLSYVLDKNRNFAC